MSKSRILLVQFNRLGDILQTILAVRDFKENYPEIEVGIVTRKSFGKPLRFLIEKYFDAYFFIDTQEIFSKPNLDNAILQLDGHMNQINGWGPKIAINLSFSKSSQSLMGLITTAHKMGPYLTTEGKISVPDRWSQYILGNVLQSSSTNVFHLVDLFRFIIGQPVVKREPAQVNEEGDFFIVHSRTSLDRKNWEAHRWAEYLQRLSVSYPEKRFLLVGSEDDREPIQKILDNKNLVNNKVFENVAGNFSIEELTEKIKDCYGFIGHDSMGAHIASLVNRKSLIITLGSARAEETSPYGEGHFVLTPKTACFPCMPDTNCNYFLCHDDINPHLASLATDTCFQGKDFINSINASGLPSVVANKVTLFETKIETERGLILYNHNEIVIDTNLLIRAFYESLWSFLFLDLNLNLSLPTIPRESKKELEKQFSGVEKLYELAEFGCTFSKTIMSELDKELPRIEEIKKYNLKLEEIDALTEGLAELYPLVRPAYNYFRVSRSNLEGNNLKELTQNCYIIYKELAQNLMVISEYLIQLGIISENSPENIKEV